MLGRLPMRLVQTGQRDSATVDVTSVVLRSGVAAVAEVAGAVNPKNNDAMPVRSRGSDIAAFHRKS